MGSGSDPGFLICHLLGGVQPSSGSDHLCVCFLHRSLSLESGGLSPLVLSTPVFLCVSWNGACEVGVSAQEAREEVPGTQEPSGTTLLSAETPGQAGLVAGEGGQGGPQPADITPVCVQRLRAVGTG